MTGDEKTVLGSFGTELGVAIELRDADRGGQPRSSTSVSLPNRRETTTLTPSGYHVLTDLPDDIEEVTVVVDADNYLSEHRKIDLHEIDRSTAQTIDLVPSPAFPFASGLTLVRGFVTDGGPLERSVVTIQERPETTRTTADGEFALPVRAINDADVSSSGALQVGGEEPTLEARHPDSGATTMADTEVPIGETTRLDLSF